MDQNKEKIGVGIVTYNSEDYFKALYNSLPLNVIDELVVINGGDQYKENYTCHWVQHNTNCYPAVCRNDAVSFLLNRNCDHIFLIEDDMIIKDSNIFDKYIQTSKVSGLKYFSYVSTSWESGAPGNRTPRLTVEYNKDTSVSFYKNMCNEFTYHHRTAFEHTGLYDTQFRDPFDIDLAYRESRTNYAAPFWWFADITNSDELIENNPVAVSRLQSERPDGSREQRIKEQWKLFINKHGVMVNEIPDTSKEIVINKLTKIKK
jgi:glycosyltransferase involved in cell wall biosynthesis